MAELKQNRRYSFKRRLFTLLLFLILLVPLFYADGFVVEAAARNCPDGTLLSGQVHRWSGWSFALLGTAIFMLTFQAIERLQKSDTRDDDFLPVLGKMGQAALVIFAAATIIFYWVGSSSQFCLASDAIYHRDLPWQAFKRHQWSDVKTVNVTCDNNFRAPDLYYKLTFGDGVVLDIADAFPSRGKYPQFQSHLANVPFKFSAEIGSGCPEWFSDWVGQRP